MSEQRYEVVSTDKGTIICPYCGGYAFTTSSAEAIINGICHTMGSEEADEAIRICQKYFTQPLLKEAV